MSDKMKETLISMLKGAYRDVKKFPSTRIADQMLQGWSFTGVTAEQHAIDRLEIINFVNQKRKL